MFRGNLDYIDEAVQITAKRQKTVQYLLRKHPVDFLMVVFSEIDRISHYYWHYYDRHSKYYDDHVAEKYRNALADIYERTDTALGSILCDLPEDCLLVVVSDHGFGRGQVNFHLQDFLIDNGFARVKSAAPEAQERAPGNWFVFGQDGASYELDWDRTRCFMACPGSYGININLRDRQRRGVVGPDELEALTRDLQSALRSVRSPETGEPLFESVLPRQAVYHGPTVERAPDMVVQPRSYGTMLHHRIVRGNWFSEPEHKGMHRLWGIVMVAGPGIQPGRLRDAALEDIAPTLLSWLSLPVPGHMEGQCLPVLGATGGHRSPTPGDQRQDAGGGAAGAAPNTYSPEEKKEIAARLSALGYL
jgi:predicted AlkP superfamily phosphohydrolase/phosphomutase